MAVARILHSGGTVPKRRIVALGTTSLTDDGGTSDDGDVIPSGWVEEPPELAAATSAAVAVEASSGGRGASISPEVGEVSANFWVMYTDGV